MVNRRFLGSRHALSGRAPRATRENASLPLGQGPRFSNLWDLKVTEPSRSIDEIHGALIPRPTRVTNLSHCNAEIGDRPVLRFRGGHGTGAAEYACGQHHAGVNCAREVARTLARTLLRGRRRPARCPTVSMIPCACASASPPPTAGGALLGRQRGAVGGPRRPHPHGALGCTWDRRRRGERRSGVGRGAGASAGEGGTARVVGCSASFPATN